MSSLVFVFSLLLGLGTLPVALMNSRIYAIFIFGHILSYCPSHIIIIRRSHQRITTIITRGAPNRFNCLQPVKVVLAGCCASRIIHSEMYIYSRLRWRSKSLPQDLSLPPPFLPKIQNETSHQHRQTRAAFTLATLPIRRPCPRPFISCNFTVISLSLSLTGNILPATTTICCWNNHRFITGSIRIQFLACRWCLRAS